MTPFVDVANARGGGVFILVKTSNKGGAQFQDSLVDNEPLYLRVGKYVDQLAKESAKRAGVACGYGNVGAVVGATWPEQLTELRSKLPNSWFLVPGYGSQDGGAKDVAGAFDSNGLGAIINNSRGIIFAYQSEAYKDKFGEARWEEAVEASILDMIQALAAESSAGKLR